MGLNKIPETDSFRGPDIYRRQEGQVGKRKGGGIERRASKHQDEGRPLSHFTLCYSDSEQAIWVLLLNRCKELE